MSYLLEEDFKTLELEGLGIIVPLEKYSMEKIFKY